MTARTDWWALALGSIANPRPAARSILAMKLPVAVLWQLLVLIAVLSDLLLFAELEATGAGPFLGLIGDPLVLAAMQFASLVVLVMALHGVGHALGGKGDWAGAMALVVWTQAILLGFGLAQLALLVLAPPLAQALGVVTFVVLVWLLTNFAAVLHGFTNLWLVFGGIVATGLILVFGLRYLLVAIGIFLPGVV